MISQQNHEVTGKSFRVAPYRLKEHPGFYAVERGKVEVEQQALTTQ